MKKRLKMIRALQSKFIHYGLLKKFCYACFSKETSFSKETALHLFSKETSFSKETLFSSLRANALAFVWQSTKKEYGLLKKLRLCLVFLRNCASLVLPRSLCHARNDGSVALALRSLTRCAYSHDNSAGGGGGNISAKTVSKK